MLKNECRVDAPRISGILCILENDNLRKNERGNH